MARTRRALAAPSSRRWRLSTASLKFRVLHRLTVILSLRRIRDPSARPDKLRILRLRSQARFAQDDTALRNRVRTFEIHYQAVPSRQAGTASSATVGGGTWATVGVFMGVPASIPNESTPGMSHLFHCSSTRR